VSGWVLSNGEQFTDEARAPRFGFVDGLNENRYYIFPQILRRALGAGGFSNRQVIRGFADRGLIRTSEGGRKFTVVQRFSGENGPFYRYPDRRR